MITSNEPGYYEDKNFGIRIENICYTTEIETPNNFNGKKYCSFDTISLVPLQNNLIETSILSVAEKDWINNYHEKVRSTLLPLMQEKFPDAISYLLEQTAAI